MPKISFTQAIARSWLTLKSISSISIRSNTTRNIRCFCDLAKPFDSSTLSHQYSSTHNQIFPFVNLKFESVEISIEDINVSDTSDFSTRLWLTIESLKFNGKSCVYLKVPMLYAHYISVAGMFGFKFHHAEGDYATLLLWLKDSECKVPPFSTHHCGVAGAVIHENKILVVKEKAKCVGWKLPGGYSNLGEEFGEAATREVFEETGVKTEFKNVLALRHSHGIQFGRSDIYVICRLQALTTDITICVKEIADAQWMDVSQFRRENRYFMLEKVLDKIMHSSDSEPSASLKEYTIDSTISGRAPFKFYT